MLAAFLVLYSIALIGVGVWMGRRARQDDFFVGGRTLGAGLIFATFLAPNIGAGSTVGAAGMAYRDGLSAWWWNGSAGLGSLVLAFWIGPRIWRQARRHGFLTVGDFLEHHFGAGVRTMGAVLIWCGTLFILCGQLDGAAAVLKRAVGTPHAWGCFIAAAVMTAYFILGGLASAARVNSLQLVIKLLGLTLAVPLAIGLAGGWPHVEFANGGHLGFWRGPAVIDEATGRLLGSTEGWPRLLLMGPAFFLSPGLIQKAYSAKDERSLTRGIAWNAVALMIFAAVPVMLGMAARAIDPQLDASTDALPLVLSRLPLGVGGLALAAVLSAELSAADAVLFMLSTSGARDLYRGFVKPAATDAEVLRAARIFAVVGGALGFALTFFFSSVVDALGTFYSILVVSLFAPILGGLYLPRGRRGGATAAMVVGIATLAATSLITRGAGFGWASPAFIGLTASTVAYFLLAAF